MFNKSVLITGGLGFIGSSLAHKFVQLGAKVTIFDNLLENSGANLSNIEGIEEKLTIILGDIRNYEEVERAAQGKDIIFECAGQVGHVTSMENPIFDIEINCKGRINVLEACRKHNPEAKIIFIGSRAQIGKVETEKMNENSQQNPSDIYGADNMASEIYHMIYSKVYGLKTSSVRLTNIYGERAQIKNPKYGVINWMIGKAVRGEELSIFGTGEQLRDLNYIDDVVDALVLISNSEKSNGQIYMLGSGEGIKFVDIAKEIIKSAENGSLKMVPWPAEREGIEVGDVIIDYSKINNDFGWAPKTSLENGLRKTAEFYRKNMDKYYNNEFKPSEKKIIMQKKKILVTGGLGHIGSKLIREYAKREDVELIRVLDNFLVQRYCSLFNLPENAKFEFIEGDVTKIDDVKKAVNEIDVVIHLAAITDAPATINNKDETFRVNLDGLKNVIAEAIKAGVKKFLFPSTTSVYGEADGIVDEAYTNLKPSSPYAESKLMAEEIVKNAWKEHKLNTNVLRLGTIFGTSIGMRFHTAVNKFCYLASMGKPLTIWDTALHSKRPYLGLNDCIRAFQFAEEKGVPGELYNVVTKNFGMGEVIDAIKKNIPEVKITITQSPILNQKPYHVESNKIKSIGFECKDTLEESIAETIKLFSAIKNPAEQTEAKKKIFTSKPVVNESIRQAINEVLDSGMFAQGAKVKEFEEKFAKFTGSKHAIAVANGTLAIENVLRALDIKEGDEIIVPSFTTMPTIEPILRLGAKPIFVDIDEKTFNIDAEKIQNAITSKTRAIMPVHLYGNPANIEKIKIIADANDLFLIEDCCQAHDAKYRGRHVGNFGIAGCFSFYPTKNLSVLGEGGMIITDNENIARKCKMMVNHGEEGRYNHVIEGSNHRLSELHAAIGIKQLEQLPEFTKRRKEIASLYDNLLKDANLILPKETENSERCNHLYVIRVQAEKRDKIIEELKKDNIFLGIHYPIPCHKQKAVISRFNNLHLHIPELPITERISKEILSLPIYPDLEDEEVRFVCGKIMEMRNNKGWRPTNLEI